VQQIRPLTLPSSSSLINFFLHVHNFSHFHMSVSSSSHLSLLRESTTKNKNRHTILVASRFRPQLPAEIAAGGSNIVQYHPNQKTVSLKHPKDCRLIPFTFDKVFPENASQQHVFEFCGIPAVHDLFDGLSGVIFAYGMTGAGKTWSVFGSLANSGASAKSRTANSVHTPSSSRPQSPQNFSNRNKKRFDSPSVDNSSEDTTSLPSTLNAHTTDVDQRGLGPRVVAEIFDRITRINRDKNINCKFSLKISFYEIYMEKVLDLLGKENNYSSNAFSGPGGFSVPTTDHLDVKEDLNTGGFYVSGLTEIYCHSVSEVMKYIKIGNQRKKKATTSMNRDSSRSHTILSLTLTRHDYNIESTIESTLNVVDLAGSERVSRSHASGERLKEATAINKSLATLGKVIFLLTQKKKSTHIPFRESKLTKLLSESLQGNARTTLLINCSPSSVNISEILSTLRFGVSAKSIKLRNPLKFSTHENTNLGLLKKKLKNSEMKISDMEELCRTLEGDLQSVQQEGSFRLKKLKHANNILLQEIYNRRQQVLDIEEELADCRFDLQTMEFREVQISQEYEMRISQLLREVELYKNRCKELELQTAHESRSKNTLRDDEGAAEQVTRELATTDQFLTLRHALKSIRFDYDLLKLEYQRLRDDQESIFQHAQEQVITMSDTVGSDQKRDRSPPRAILSQIAPLTSPTRKGSAISFTRMTNLQKENDQMRKGIQNILDEMGPTLPNDVAKHLRHILDTKSQEKNARRSRGVMSPSPSSPLNVNLDLDAVDARDFERNMSTLTASDDDDEDIDTRHTTVSAQCGTVQMLHLESEDSDPEWKSRWLVLDVDNGFKLKCYRNMRSIIPKEISLSDVERITSLNHEDTISLHLNNKTEWSFKIPSQHFEEWLTNLTEAQQQSVRK